MSATTPYALIPRADIAASEYQPRDLFDDADLRDLADSIRAVGLLQPVVVRPAEDPGKFTLVAGERRWRACELAGLDPVPAIVNDRLTDAEAAAATVLENLQRVDLTPWEEARGFRTLFTAAGYTLPEIAERVGRSTDYVGEGLRLAQLPEEAQRWLHVGLDVERKGDGDQVATEHYQLTRTQAIACLKIAELAPEETREYFLLEASRHAMLNRMSGALLETERGREQLLRHIASDEVEGRPKVVGWLRSNMPILETHCYRCPFNAFVGDRKNQWSDKFCLKPDHLAELVRRREEDQLRQREERLATARAQLEEQGVDLAGVKQLAAMNFNDYVDLDGWQGKQKSAQCGEDCPCRATAVDSEGKLHTICCDPKRFNRLKAADTRAENKDRKDLGRERLGRMEAQIDSLATLEGGYGDNEIRTLATAALGTITYDLKRVKDACRHLIPYLGLLPDLGKQSYEGLLAKLPSLDQVPTPVLVRYAIEVLVRADLENFAANGVLGKWGALYEPVSDPDQDRDTPPPPATWPNAQAILAAGQIALAQGAQIVFVKYPAEQMARILGPRAHDLLIEHVPAHWRDGIEHHKYLGSESHTGIPYGALQPTLDALVEAGYKVAVLDPPLARAVEQLADSAPSWVREAWDLYQEDKATHQSGDGEPVRLVFAGRDFDGSELIVAYAFDEDAVALGEGSHAAEHWDAYLANGAQRDVATIAHGDIVETVCLHLLEESEVRLLTLPDVSGHPGLVAVRELLASVARAALADQVRDEIAKGELLITWAMETHTQEGRDPDEITYLVGLADGRLAAYDLDAQRIAAWIGAPQPSGEVLLIGTDDVERALATLTGEQGLTVAVVYDRGDEGEIVVHDSAPNPDPDPLPERVLMPTQEGWEPATWGMFRTPEQEPDGDGLARLRGEIAEIAEGDGTPPDPDLVPEAHATWEGFNPWTMLGTVFTTASDVAGDPSALAAALGVPQPAPGTKHGEPGAYPYAGDGPTPDGYDDRWPGGIDPLAYGPASRGTADEEPAWDGNPITHTDRPGDPVLDEDSAETPAEPPPPADSPLDPRYYDDAAVNGEWTREALYAYNRQRGWPTNADYHDPREQPPVPNTDARPGREREAPPLRGDGPPPNRPDAPPANQPTDGSAPKRRGRPPGTRNKAKVTA